MPRRTLAADMWPSLTFADPNKVYADFLASGAPRFKGLIESFLLYDEVHVPTDSFMSLALIVGVLGERATHELLDSGALRFLRFKGQFAYVGNGGGLTDMMIGPAPDKPAFAYGPMEPAIEWSLGGLDSKPDIRALLPKVIKATREVPIKEHFATVRDRTYATVSESDALHRRFSIPEGDLSRLPGINPDQVRVWPGYDEPGANTPDAIDAVLRVARGYLEATAAEQIGEADVSTSSPVGYLVENEEQTQGLQLTGLHQITKMPDLGEWVLSKQLSVADLVKLRHSYDWPAFRDWFHEHCASDPMGAAKAYIELLKHKPIADGLPLRTIRFLVTTAIGIVNPIAGIGAAAVDSYAVPLVRGRSAKIFVERLEQLTPRQSEGV